MKELKPLAFWCKQNFPFVEESWDTMTYYEMLCKIVELLNNTVSNVNELDSNFTTLKTYVENYFKDLDVQEEINTKLDEMAESGELTEIIAQYLKLAGVLAYNTIEDMKSATNIENGSICRTLGKSTYKDGYGAFYKIRTITSGDVVDDYNIVALNVSSTLIAERIVPIYESEIESNKKNFSNFFFGVFFDRNTLKLDYFTSLNGIEWAKQNIENNLGTGRDPSLIYVSELKKFIFTSSGATTSSTFDIKVSADLVNWETFRISLSGFTSENRCWAPDLLYKDGTLYVTISVGDSSDMKIYLTSTTDLTNFTNWTTPVQLNLGLSYVIDSQIKYFNEQYYLICKNGTNDNTTNPIQIFTSTDLITWNTLNTNLLNAQVEGPNLVPYDDKFLVEADLFIEHGHAIAKIQSISDLSDTSKFNWNESNNLSSNTNDVAHGAILYIDDEEENSIIKKLDIDFSGSQLDERNINSANIEGTIENFVVLPGYQYNITGNPTITNLLNPFGVRFIIARFATNVNNTLTITNAGHDLQNMHSVNLTLNNSCSVNEEPFILDISHAKDGTIRSTLPVIKDVDISSYWQSPSGLTLNSARLVTHGTAGMITLSITATESVSSKWFGQFIQLPSNLYRAISNGGGMICGDKKNIYQLNANTISANLTLTSGQNEIVRIPFIA